MNYKVIDKEKYYRKGVFRHFSEDCKYSTSMTARIDVTDLVYYSKNTETKFYINFLYILSKVLNSRDDYRMGYLWQTGRFGWHFFTQIALLLLQKDDELTPNSLEKLATLQKIYTVVLFFTIF